MHDELRVLSTFLTIAEERSFTRAAKRLGVSPSALSHAIDVGLMMQAALDGVGLAFADEEHADPHLKAGALVRVLEDWCQPFPGFFLYYPSQRHQPAALSALIETLRL